MGFPMSFSSYLRPIETLLLLVSLGLASLACGGDDAGSPSALSGADAPRVVNGRTDPELAAIALRVRHGRAAKGGISWMLEHHAEMPAGWVHPFFSRLERVVRDPTTRAEIDRTLQEDALSGLHVSLPADFEDPLSLRPGRLTPVLFELKRRKQVGLPYADHQRALAARIARDEAAFWAPVQPLQQAVYLHLLGALGIDTQRTLDQLIAESRATTAQRSAADLGADLQFMYTLTHQVLARSSYFRRKVDAEEFEFALPAFRAALAHGLKSQKSEHFFDLSAEVLVCYSLLQLPDEALTRQTRASIVKRQNRDGSWGRGDGVSRNKVHLTFTSVMANLLFQPNSDAS